MQLLGHADDGTPIYASPTNRQPRKRVRRGKLKSARNAYQRENVLTDRDCLSPSRRSLTEQERAERMPPKQQSSRHAYKPDNYEGNPLINSHDYSGVETHPVPSFVKNSDYQHGALSSPSHLWCDVVHATDSDVTKGNRSK